MSERNVGVVIVAGGSGSRVGGEELKQFRWIAGKPMLLHSLQTFMAHPRVIAVVCVLPMRYAGDPPPWIFQCDVDRLLVSVGGRTRTESVANGIDDLVDEAQVVLIHDAARPFVDTATIDRVIASVDAGHATTAAVPVVDTLKEVDDDMRVARTVDRARLWRAQTPQGFTRETIVRVHREARARRLTATDDAALCEQLGIPVAVVRGDERAMKITEEADFARAEALFTLSS
ncbi:MAG: 2-C-methyl-D-erythritol 4-phosphate cytidylyltransferase [Gemmatimonadota bacterium]|nr:2-C-methyl-D-erythritol 4-phosphate cytidylyltransferase [Gemmatimonadota bacterium]HEU4989822.1 2-C-methyl-D-erythritol 4-phosphate cytidylyltransferase [Gemmatimonadaceae bacterium]